MTQFEPRRLAPRISIEGLCGVVANDELSHASLLLRDYVVETRRTRWIIEGAAKRCDTAFGT